MGVCEGCKKDGRGPHAVLGLQLRITDLDQAYHISLITSKAKQNVCNCKHSLSLSWDKQTQLISLIKLC